MTVGQIVGVIGVTSSAATAVIAASMSRRARDIESGALVRQNLQAHGIPDVWASHIANQGRFQRGWGMRTTSTGQRRPHGAVDICGPQGTIIHAMRSGLVEHSGQVNGYGECILLRHSDGSSSLYAHLNERGVEKGALVQGGSPIAVMGRTSNTGTKPTNASDQGSPYGRDPRCTQFGSMGLHTHMSVHGAGEQKLPHSALFNRAVSSDKEWRYGTDPVQYLGAHGVRLFARELPTCPAWSADWSIA